MKIQRLITKPSYMIKGHFYWKLQKNSYGYTSDYVLVTYQNQEYSIFQIDTIRPLKGNTYQYLSGETNITADTYLTLEHVKNEFFISDDVSDIDQKVINEINEEVQSYISFQKI